MTNRWSTLRIDEASVMHLGVIDTPTLGRHADALASRRPSPQELFQRWDTQQWKIADIELEKDIPGENNPNKQYRQTQATGRQGRASKPSIACTTQARPRRRGVSRSTQQGHLKNCLAGVFGLRWVRLGLHHSGCSRRRLHTCRSAVFAHRV